MNLVAENTQYLIDLEKSRMTCSQECHHPCKQIVRKVLYSCIYTILFPIKSEPQLFKPGGFEPPFKAAIHHIAFNI